MSSDFFLFCSVISSYNALERREACKGGKEVSKKCQAAVAKSTGTTSKTHSSHGPRKNDLVSRGNGTQTTKACPPNPSEGRQLDEKVIIIYQCQR